MLLTVLITGGAALGIEMLAARVMAPFFGTSQPIWAAVIGTTLGALALGYALGGRLAARGAGARTLYGLVLAAGVLSVLIAPLANPLLRIASSAIGEVAVAGFAGALVGVLVLFVPPVLLLAAIGPIAVGARVAAGADAGRAAGTISALSTVGSIIGTFLTVLVLIPAIGSTRSLLLFAAVLLVLGALGLQTRRATALATVAGLVIIVLASGIGQLKTAGCTGCTLLAERESGENYIQIVRRDAGPLGPQVALLLNEGFAVHSVYNERYSGTRDARSLLTGGGPWDYFAVAPFFAANRDETRPPSLAMIGSAGGTVPAQFLAIFGPETRIDAVEIDPAISAMAREYMHLRDASVDPQHPNYQVHDADGRVWLAQASGSYDVIGMDAYRQPYIPFHLTTVEFFALVRSRLTVDGVAVVNAGLGPGGDDRLVRALTTTMRQVFPNVYVVQTLRRGNQILVGVNRDDGDGIANLAANYNRLRSPALRETIASMQARADRPTPQDPAPFTDDHAPVEQVIDALILRAVSGE